ncbi:MAG TPA: hypothetical protein PLB91_05830 [Spirochaetales bacterium]|nr:hypothetical protein [Spirochaetales bacterium]HRY53730.1 hypothetical protein [Spirochaetia bacterium]
MKSLSCQFEGLADREGFNASVRHAKTVISAVDRIEDKENLADIIGELVDAKALDRDEIRPVVSMILGDKFKYRRLSANLSTVATDLGAITEEVAKWNGVDLVVLYFHPDLGVIAVNPKNPRRMGQIDRLNRPELLVAYAGRFAKEGDPKLLDAACEALVDLFSGRKPKARPELLKGDCAYKAPKDASEPKAPKAKAAPKAAPKAPKAAAKKGRGPVAPAPEPVPEPPKAAVAAAQAVKPGARMTPMYSVLVTNELFHNGNVEAWKRIIASYNAKHPDLTVLVYYDGERITDINALFKWGKVKHGSTIQFAIAGENICDVAKLQRYLSQGASHLFEAFLRGPVNSVMALF